MVVKTNYRKSGAKKLVKYIKSHGRLYDRSGREIDYPTDFVRRSFELNFNRMIILSPDYGNEMSDLDFKLYVQKMLEAQFGDCPTVDYVFSIHRETSHPHVIVALTGVKRDLYLNRGDLERMRDREHEIFCDLGYERPLEYYRELRYDYEL